MRALMLAFRSLLVALLLPFAAGAQTAGTSFLTTQGFLTNNQVLVSPQRLFFAIMQGDGNFCVYRGSGPTNNLGSVWCTGTGGRTGASFALIQRDGNFCLYRGTGPTNNLGNYWCSYSNGAKGENSLAMQDDSRLAVYGAATPGTVSAKWRSPGWSLTATPPTGGQIVDASSAHLLACDSGGQQCQASYAPGTALTLQAVPAAGYVFSSWTGLCAGKGAPCTVTLGNGNATVGASFVAAPSFPPPLPSPTSDLRTKATQACTSAMTDPVANAILDPAQAIEFCVSDVMLTGSFDFVPGHVANYKAKVAAMSGK